MKVKDYADLIQALSTLLWPIFAFFVLFFFSGEIRALLKRFKKGKLLGQEIELSDELKPDESSKILNDYLFPRGKYSEERRNALNALLQELGILQDIGLMLDGAASAPLRTQLIQYAKKKGFGLNTEQGAPPSEAE